MRATASLYALAHVGDDTLLRELASLVAQDRSTTAKMLAHLAEVDSRKLYLQAGYPSMHSYCVEALRLSDDAAFKRIQGARAARKHPAIFAAVEEGRLHLTAVRLIAPYLTPENAHELLEAATHRRRSEIERMLAQRFPPEQIPAPSIRALHRRAITSPPMRKRVLGQVAMPPPSLLAPTLPAGPVVSTPLPPVSAGIERYSVHVTIDKSTHDKLRYAQELLSHSVPSGDVAQVLDRALDALIGKLEKQKFSAATRPRLQDQGSSRKRHVPARVRRAVWKRDGGRCTFVGDRGRRCDSRKLLEFDHVDPVALGGKAVIAQMRLRCRAHNQLEAERAFGAGFMDRKRHERREWTEGQARQDREGRQSREDHVAPGERGKGG